MECAVCHRREKSKTRCVNGHYVCNDCHTRGMDGIFALCLGSRSRSPLRILEEMMSLPFCHMHGPEHHVMVGAALLTAYRNAGGELDLERALSEMYSRGSSVPGGMYCSIAAEATPLSGESWSLANQLTSRALAAIAAHGGPRCCKRDSYLALREAIAFTSEKLGVELEAEPAICSRSEQNRQCLHEGCPFYTGEGGRHG